MTAPAATMQMRQTVPDLEVPAGLVILARAYWPEPGDGTPPPIPGFIVSSFSPLVAEVARRCLAAEPTVREVPSTADGAAHAAGRRTAIVLASRYGDLASAVQVAAAVDAGTRVGPLMFFQAVPNAVAGHIAAHAGLTGPIVCLSPSADPPAHTIALREALAEAELLIADGDADEALVIVAEQAGGTGEPDRAFAMLVGRLDAAAASPGRTAGHLPAQTPQGGAG